MSSLYFDSGDDQLALLANCFRVTPHHARWQGFLFLVDFEAEVGEEGAAEFFIGGIDKFSFLELEFLGGGGVGDRDFEGCLPEIQGALVGGDVRAHDFKHGGVPGTEDDLALVGLGRF
jgi:hypothetical protein